MHDAQWQLRGDRRLRERAAPSARDDSPPTPAPIPGSEVLQPPIEAVPTGGTVREQPGAMFSRTAGLEHQLDKAMGAQYGEAKAQWALVDTRGPSSRSCAPPVSTKTSGSCASEPNPR